MEAVLLRTPIEARTVYILPLNKSSVSGLLKCSQLFSDGCIAAYVFIHVSNIHHSLNLGIYRSQNATPNMTQLSTAYNHFKVAIQ